MKRVIIESPYAGKRSRWPWPISIVFEAIDRWRNVRYLRKCLHDSLMRGEAPFASHAIYTQRGVLRDSVESERRRGIEAGFVWGQVASLRAFYTDRGFSRGMELGLDAAKRVGQATEIRSIQKPHRVKLPELSVVKAKGEEP